MSALLDDRLRRSSAHVVVGDVSDPRPDEHDWHHLRRVLRLRDGEPVTVTDGAGSWRECAIDAAGLVVTGDVVVEPEPAAAVIAAAPPKGDRLEWLVGKCTELGATAVVLLRTDRTVTKLDGERGERQLERLRRIARESAMQSRRVWLPTVAGPLTVAELLERHPTVVFAEPGGRPLAPGERAVAIGPEGGWTDDELAAVEPGRRIRLTGNVLRVETAALAAATLLAVDDGAAVS